MGELYFETTGNKFSDTIGAIISFIAFIAIGGYFLSNLSGYTMGVLTVAFIIALGCLWYAYDRIINAWKSKILFYENGMVVVKGKQEFVILMSEIKDLKMTEKSGDDYLLTFTFEMKDGEFYSIDSDDYAKFPELMKEYGKKFDLDWSFR